MKQHKSSRLTEALAPAVDSDVRRRGESYFRHGRIFETKATSDRLDAEVRGKGGNYKVTVEMSRDEAQKRSVVTGVCACPYFAKGSGYCKHIWAVICLADGMRDSPFKAPPEHQVTLRSIAITKPIGNKNNIGKHRVRSLVASAEPDPTGRMRIFSPAQQAKTATESKRSRRRKQREGRSLVSWREALKVVGHAQRDAAEAKRPAVKSANDVYYVVDDDATLRTGKLTVQIFRQMHDEGGVTQLVSVPVDPSAPLGMEPGPDRKILSKFFSIAASSIVRMGQWDEPFDPIRVRTNSFTVADEQRSDLLELMISTGRFGWLDTDDAKLEGSGMYPRDSFRALKMDDDGPWTFGVAVNLDRNGQSWRLRGEFRRGKQTVPLADALATFPDGYLLMEESIARFEAMDARAYGWVEALRQVGTFEVTKAEQAAFLRQFAGLQSAPPLDLPQSSGWKVVEGEPKPRLTFLTMPITDMPTVLTANYEFTYDASSIANAQAAQLAPGDEAAQQQQQQGGGRRRRGRRGRGRDADGQQPQPGSQDSSQQQGASQARVVARRNREREDALIRDLCAHPGVHPSAGRDAAGADVFVDAMSVSSIVADLTERGWAVEAEGKKLRVGRSFMVDVTSSSGMDWLDLRALFDFGDGAAVQLPRILDAVRRGSDRVDLGDGTVGLLPAAWRDKLEPILRMGAINASDGNALRYRGNQAAFLDALVAEASEAHLDKPFAAFREKLTGFTGLNQAEPAQGFVGELRPYQRQGLGWLEFLDDFALGGCLADEMGLGKTVQVLAHLHKRSGGGNAPAVVATGTKRKRRTKASEAEVVEDVTVERSETRLPNLIVAPTSLIHNWVDEAQKFVPGLKVYAHLGGSRHREPEDLAAYNLVVTSYGTMRSDIELLAKVPFDVIVLDEAQAIKNETTQVTQAARLLNGKRRLAMSGTPVENRLSELGSLFKFLNPGLIESSSGFEGLFSGSGKLQQGQLQTLARLLKPFILRRTKTQVLPDLPSKTESTVFCVLEDNQRREYDALAAFYRDSLKKKIKAEGLGKSRMHVLEALLRLRQMACHPGLIDEQRAFEPSAKLDLLEEQIDEVLESGHKALVFSQFTSMLSIVRQRLDQKGIVYEYLDGSTTNRKEKVERFQSDDSVKLFLISLKAGGVGLNLTAADYCFILDPWWNPATEAQAIDRAHRIGQKNHVFAYRLIARGTVEEKILALQASKRQLVEGIIADDGDVMASLTAKDLDFLLE